MGQISGRKSLWRRGNEIYMKKFELPGQLDWSGTTQEERVHQNAINRVRLAHEVAKGELLYVAFSGGKDSTALWEIVCEAAEKDGVPIELYAARHYNITGIDPPELVYHMRDNCPDLNWHMYDQSFWRLVVTKGPPTRLKRWCCAELKEGGGAGFMCCTGVRWAESQKRAGRAAFEKLAAKKENKMLLNDNDDARRYFEHCIPKSKRICNPIVDWTTDNVWDYIRDRGAPYCKLYDDGFKRLGCIGCPMAGEMRKVAFERWPKYKYNYIRAFDRMVRRRLDAEGTYNLGWTCGQDVFDWWMDDRNMDKPVPGQMEWDDMTA